MTIHYSKEIQVKDYFDIYTHYVKQFGKNILILMQVGSFHECYNTDNEGPDLFILGERINMTVTQKNKSKPLSISNPRMMGFPSYIVDDMIDKIVKFGYTVVRIDQTTEPPLPKREIVGIFSPGTLINSTSNNLICIIIDALKLKTQYPILCIGITSYNMATGIGCCYETVSTQYDTMLALDNIIRFLEKYPAGEIIYHFSDGLMEYINTNGTINKMSCDDIIKYLGIKDNITMYKINNFNIISNVKFMESTIKSVFNTDMEHINLHAYNYARISLVALIDYVKNHQQVLLNKLTEPTYFEHINTLYLGNRALSQLMVLPSNIEDKCNITLFDIICKTKTPMGKRFLYEELCNPIIDSNELNNRYNIIEIILKNNIFNKLSDVMTNIYDIPKLVRKIELNKIHPNELYQLYASFIQIVKTFKMIRTLDEKDRIVFKNILEIDKLKTDELKKIINHMEHTFDLEYIQGLLYNNYKDEEKNYIINEKYPNIINLTKKIETSNNFMENLVSILDKYIADDNKVIKKDFNAITLKNNDRDGFYLLLTKRRAKILLDKLSKLEEIDINGVIIKVKDLEFNDLPKSNNTKITCKDIIKISSDVVILKSQLANELKDAFYKEANIIIDIYGEVIKKTSNIIKILDFLNSGAISAYMNGYCKPTIEKADISFFEAENLRHPIVEIINKDIIYYPYNIELGKTKNGILLFGLNAAGKSTLMKSIGLAIILAQIGYYVPASKYTFQPYKNMFTRIQTIDNIYKGLSSFMVELYDIISILLRHSSNTLVIADEVCSSTEEKSANIIVAYMLETLEKSNTSFITATHLHGIAELPSVKNLKKIKIMHIKVRYDDVKDMLIYERKLSEGEGDKYYGVMVAKYTLRNDDFNRRTKEIEMEYDDYFIKKSKYNSSILAVECFICKSKNKLETHHINFQKDFMSNNRMKDKEHIQKNANYNLIILCSHCHDEVDRGNIIINQWIKTSNGIELDWYKK